MQLKRHRVDRWVKIYWDKYLGDAYGFSYSSNAHGNRVVSFKTFVELYIMGVFHESGVKPQTVIRAHQELGKMFSTKHPFALEKVMQGIRCSGSSIYFEIDGENIIHLDGTKQLALRLIKLFYTKIDFDENNVASRFWPMGKEAGVLVDPQIKFGRVILDKLHIYPETLFGHFQAGDPVAYIAHIFEIEENLVLQAIKYCSEYKNVA